MAYNANYHAQCNPTERVNRVVKTMLTAYVKDRHRLWDSYLQQVGFAIRSSKHEVTGQTPNFVNFGRELTIDGREETFVPSDVPHTSPTVDDILSTLVENLRLMVVRRHLYPLTYHIRHLQWMIESWLLLSCMQRSGYDFVKLMIRVLDAIIYAVVMSDFS
ncbi:Integrase zinc binding domain [Popillia japonica]|uniref:Integrase zinc binding domain n=1 Tax=Popillia japonica TaxID=7064 RepID=A0AAW1HEY5_POPJA